MGCSFRWGLRLAVCNHAAGSSRAERRTEQAWKGSGGALKAFTTPEYGRENDNARTRHFSNAPSSLAPFLFQTATPMRRGSILKIPLSRQILCELFLASNARSVPFWPENAARISHQALIFFETSLRVASLPSAPSLSPSQNQLPLILSPRSILLTSTGAAPQSVPEKSPRAQHRTSTCRPPELASSVERSQAVPFQPR